MNIHLIIHNAGYVLDVVMLVFFIILISLKAQKGMAKNGLILVFLGVIVFAVSHALGVSVSDPELSGKILMFNLVDILIPIFSAHCVFALLGKGTKQKKVLIVLYVVGIGLVSFFLLNPQLFLQTSIPKMYFPNYYVPGPYYWVMLLFFFSLSTYFFLWMRKMYVVADGVEKSKIKYFSSALLLAYLFGSVDFLLIYNIPFDPLWGFLFVPLFSVPFVYAVLQYDIMNISIVAQKAFIYAVITAVIGGVLSVLNYANTVIIQSYPGFPDWTSSLVLALFVALAVLLIWKKVREADILKYEFINVITHKFRTPITSIKWVSENLLEEAPESMKEDIKHLRLANERLGELTNLLVNLSGMDDKSYEYTFAPADIGALMNDCVADVMKKAESKHIELSYIPRSGMLTSIDAQKIKFVLQTMIDNSVTYTPDGGKIIVEASQTSGKFSVPKLIISVSDTGIGIPKDEIKHVFIKFYRTENGRKADTEGMGIGLYLARRIVERHNGKMFVQSAGNGKGSTFTVVLPMKK